jgi:hypothetical protein
VIGFTHGRKCQNCCSISRSNGEEKEDVTAVSDARCSEPEELLLLLSVFDDVNSDSEWWHDEEEEAKNGGGDGGEQQARC